MESTTPISGNSHEVNSAALENRFVHHALDRLHLHYRLSNGCYLHPTIDDDAELPYANELCILRMQIWRRCGVLVPKKLLRAVVRDHWGMRL